MEKEKILKLGDHQQRDQERAVALKRKHCIPYPRTSLQNASCKLQILWTSVAHSLMILAQPPQLLHSSLIH